MRVAQVQRVARVAERNSLIASAIHAGRRGATQPMACHLLIPLSNFAESFKGIGAAADVLASEERPGHQLVAMQCN